jgi:mono/diheme cytochrome c family protein
MLKFLYFYHLNPNQMRKATTYLLAIICSTLIIYSCSKSTEKTGEEKTAMTPEEMIKRGEFLVSWGGCNDCHTPKTMTAQGPAMDMSKMLFGPWGISYAANLTPHETGIKNWTEETFLNIFKTGKHLGLENGRPIMPPMPWEAFKMLSEEDMKAIFAYLKSIPPVDNVVPAYTPPGS